MTTIHFDPEKMTYDASTATFTASEKDVKFDTAYKLVNPGTGRSGIFEFSHSAGPEFDPNTIYVYKGPKGGLMQLTLNIINDAKITEIRAAAYLEAKTQ